LTAPSPKPATRQPLDDAFFSTLLDGGGECKDVPAALPGDQRAERSEHSPHAGKDEDVAGGAFA
jgi:hypothetical protein